MVGIYLCVEWCVSVCVLAVSARVASVRIYYYFYLIAERVSDPGTYSTEFPKFQLWPQLSVPHSAENLGFARPENFSPSEAACLNGPIDKSRERNTTAKPYLLHIVLALKERKKEKSF